MGFNSGFKGLRRKGKVTYTPNKLNSLQESVGVSCVTRWIEVQDGNQSIAEHDTRSSSPNTKVREEEAQVEHVTDGREAGFGRKEE